MRRSVEKTTAMMKVLPLALFIFLSSSLKWIIHADRRFKSAFFASSHTNLKSKGRARAEEGAEGPIGGSARTEQGAASDPERKAACRICSIATQLRAASTCPIHLLRKGEVTCASRHASAPRRHLATS